MTFITAPAVIEQSDWNGYAPDPEPVSLGPGQLIDVLNLLPDRGSSALVTRKGFRRLREKLKADGAFDLLQVSQWHTSVNGTPTAYLICVVSDHSAGSDNVQLLAVDLSDNSVARIDDSGVTWANPDSWHWGMGIDGLWYGGSQGNKMYSWDPDGDTWDADVSTGNYRTVVDDNNDGVDTTTEVGKDFAHDGKDFFTYDGDTFQASKKIRADTWNDGDRYERSDHVSLYATWESTSAYWKSFRCIAAHTASSSNKPGVGVDTATYWQLIRLPLPKNSDGDTVTDAWNFIPLAPDTHVAMWHNNSLWLRDDSYGQKDRVLFSAPVKAKKGEDIPDTVFDPKDFAPGGDLRGPGGGWIPFNDGKHGGYIEALRSYGTYGMVFKRRAVWVIAGESEESWTVRKLEQAGGCVGPAAHCELEGLVYYLSDDALRVTDGTSTQVVDGSDNIRVWLGHRLDSILANITDDESDGRRPVVWAQDGFVWMSLCDDSDNTTPFCTLVYDPKTATFWKLDLPVQDVAQARKDGVLKHYFAAVADYGGGCLIYQYGKSNADDADDTGAADYEAQDLPWSMRTAWWPFGLLREQRRVRRVWAVVKGALDYQLIAYRDWSNSAAKTTNRTVSASTPTHIEGEYFADCHAVSFDLSSDASPAVVHGIAVQTQPRRVRYHT